MSSSTLNESLPPDIDMESLPSLADSGSSCNGDSGSDKLLSDTSDEESLPESLPSLAKTLDGTLQDDVVEIFSMPRVVPIARAAGLRAELSVDIHNSCDLTKNICRAWLLCQIEARRPRVVISSPPCTMHSQLMFMNMNRMDPADLRERMETAMSLLEFSFQVARMQEAAHRSFVHEHPASATSWRKPCTRTLLAKQSFQTVVFDQCRFGLQSPAGWPLKKPTRFLFCNLPSLAAKFNVRCCCKKALLIPTKTGFERRLHKAILGNEKGVKVSRHAQTYPPALVKALVDVIRVDVCA